MSRLQLPGQGPQINLQWVPMDLAQPAVCNIGHNGAALVAAFGGFSKLEQGALIVAGGMMADVCEHAPVTRETAELARSAVDMAQAVRAEVARRQAKPEEPQHGEAIP